MKVITKPSSTEECVYYSDFVGKLFELAPEVEVTFEFNYGSKRDGDKFTLHLTEKEYVELEKFLSTKLTSESKKKNGIK
jgi:hypothetical protein